MGFQETAEGEVTYVTDILGAIVAIPYYFRQRVPNDMLPAS